MWRAADGLPKANSALPRGAGEAVDIPPFSTMHGGLRGGMIVEVPVHDAASHGADALRTFGEAHLRGMIEGPSEVAQSSYRAAHPVRVLRAGSRARRR